MSVVLRRAAAEEGAPMRPPVLVSGGGVPLTAGEVGSCTSRRRTWMLPAGPAARVTFLREATRWGGVIVAGQSPVGYL